MKFNKILDLKAFARIGFFVKNNRLIIFLTVSFILGLLFGSYSDFGGSLRDFAEKYFSSFVSIRQSESFLRIFFHSFMTSALWLLVSFFLGTGVMGFLILPVSSAVFGFFYGAVISYLYSEYALLGVAFHAVILLPSALLTVLAFLLSSAQSVRFSRSLSGLVFYSRSVDLSVLFKEFCKSFLYYLLVIFISAILDGLFSIKFLGSFGIL